MQKNISKKNYALFMLVILAAFLPVFLTTSTVEAKSDVKLKIIRIKQKKDKLCVKVKISNNTKRFVEISSESVLYERKNHKWKKMKWNEKHATSDTLFGLDAGASRTYTFCVNFDELVKEVQVGKSYRMGIEIDGKYKKTRKIKVKK